MFSSFGELLFLVNDLLLASLEPAAASRMLCRLLLQLHPAIAVSQAPLQVLKTP